MICEHFVLEDEGEKTYLKYNASTFLFTNRIVKAGAHCDG